MGARRAGGWVMVYMIGMPPIMGQYPEEEFVDGNTSAIKLRGPITDEMRPDISIRHTLQYEIGFPIAADNVPTTWRWASSQPLPDFYTPRGFPCISPRVKDIIESFEPGVHQFFPIKVIDKKDREI